MHSKGLGLATTTVNKDYAGSSAVHLDSGARLPDLHPTSSHHLLGTLPGHITLGRDASLFCASVFLICKMRTIISTLLGYYED